MDLINKTREYFIERSGESCVKIENGLKHRYINTDLNNFDKLIECLKKAFEICGLEFKEDVKQAICEFAKAETPDKMENINKKLEKLIANWQKGKAIRQKDFVEMIKELEADLELKKITKPTQLVIYFEDFLNVSKCNNNKVTSRTVL